MSGPALLEYARSAEHRPLMLKCRSDLVVHSRIRRGQTFYIIKNGLTLGLSRLQAEEYWLLQQLDGKKSLLSIKEAFEEKFHGKRCDIRRLEKLVRYFYHCGLVIACTAGQGELIFQRKQRESQARAWWSFSSWTAIRFKGVNPDPILNSLVQRCSKNLAPALFVAACVSISVTILFALINLRPIWFRLPQIQEVMDWSSLVILFLVILIMRVFHEIGHALTCKYFGGECNEIGVVFLFFVPCLYCDVSDSWTITSRWKRIAIAAAGVVVDCWIASIGFWVWWFSNPGLVQTLALQVWVMGFVNSVFINGNPLMRYDGYFVLSDLCDIPNLWLESRKLLASSVKKFFWFGWNSDSERPWGHDPVARMCCYALASMTYQLFALISVAVIVYLFFFYRRLEFIGVGLVLFLIGSVLIRMMKVVSQSISNKSRGARFRTGRAALISVLVFAMTSFVLFFPFPQSVVVMGIVRSPELTPLTALATGQLLSFVEEGTEVAIGASIVEMESMELSQKLAQRQGELRRQKAKLLGLETRRSVDKSVAIQLAPTREAVEGLELEVQTLLTEIGKLTLRSPSKGIVEYASNSGKQTEMEQTTWSNTPLSRSNIGATIAAGTPLCWIRHKSGLEAFAYPPQETVELLSPGQKVIVHCKFDSSIKLHGEVVDIASSSVDRLPPELVWDRRFALKKPDSTNTNEPVFVVRIKSDSNPISNYENGLAKIRIHVAPQSLAARILRWAHITFSRSVKGSVQQPL